MTITIGLCVGLYIMAGVFISAIVEILTQYTSAGTYQHNVHKTPLGELVAIALLWPPIIAVVGGLCIRDIYEQYKGGY